MFLLWKIKLDNRGEKNEMKRWIFGVFLAIAAGQDFRKKQVDIWVYELFGGFALLNGAVHLLVGASKYQWLQSLGGICLGLLIVGGSVVSHGRIGLGDGYFFCVSGVLLGFQENMMLLCGGVLCSGLYSLVYLVWMRFAAAEIGKMRKQVIPFLPFLIPTGIWLICR